MDALTLFGLFAVAAMLIFYTLESRSHWFVLAFAGACADSDEAGHAFQYEAGRPFRSEAGQRSDLMSATDCLLSQIEVDDVSDVVGGQVSADFRRSDVAFAGCLRSDRCDRRCG